MDARAGYFDALGTRGRERIVRWQIAKTGIFGSRRQCASGFSRSLDRGITPRTLLEIEMFARSARELLAVGKVPESLGRHRTSGYVTSNPTYTMQSMGSSDESYSEGENQAYGALAPSSQAETFGASYMRERVASFGVRDMTPKEIVESLVVAKANGLTELATMLEQAMIRALDPAGPRQPKPGSLAEWREQTQ